MGNDGVVELLKKFHRPCVSVVEDFLLNQKGLIVHFSGAPKGAGVERGLLFPDDLKNVMNGRCQGGLSCSVVMPGDNFFGLARNATGCVGLVLKLNSPGSLVAISPHDCGSREDANGNRVVDKICDITVHDLEASIIKRGEGSYNEWVVRDFRVSGLFVVPPYEIFAEVSIDHPEKMPFYMRSKEPELQVMSISVEEIRQHFSTLPVYTFVSGEIAVTN